MTGFRVDRARRAGALRHHAGPHHARQGDRRRHAGRARSAGGATSWRRSRRSGRCIRPGRCPGNPVAVAAGLATLEASVRSRVLRSAVRDHDAALVDGLNALAAKRGVAFSARTSAACSACFSAARPPAVVRRGHAIGQGALQPLLPRHARGGVYFAPSAYEAGFVSGAHACRRSSPRRCRVVRSRRSRPLHMRNGAEWRRFAARAGSMLGAGSRGFRAGVRRPRARRAAALPARLGHHFVDPLSPS